jgi:hypothetical protein
MSENDDKKSDQRIVYIITIISPNNWRTRSKKHRKSAIGIRKPLFAAQKHNSQPPATIRIATQNTSRKLLGLADEEQ